MGPPPPQLLLPPLGPPAPAAAAAAAAPGPRPCCCWCCLALTSADAAATLRESISSELSSTSFSITWAWWRCTTAIKTRTPVQVEGIPASRIKVRVAQAFAREYG